MTNIGSPVADFELLMAKALLPSPVKPGSEGMEPSNILGKVLSTPQKIATENIVVAI